MVVPKEFSWKCYSYTRITMEIRKKTAFILNVQEISSKQAHSRQIMILLYRVEISIYHPGKILRLSEKIHKRNHSNCPNH